MKNCFVIFFLLLFCFKINSQTVFNADLIREIETQPASKLVNVLVLLKTNHDLLKNKFDVYKEHYRIGNIYSLTTSLENIKKLGKQNNILRIEYAKNRLKPMDDTSDVNNCINSIKAGLAPLNQSYDGSNIIVGIIDTGIDFSHPDFKDSNGKSRVKFLWDMTKAPAFNTPTNFGYGQEWTNSEIDLGICTHNPTASFGHGTAVSGIAAGNGLAANIHAGVAPKADLIVVALDFYRNGFVIADAVNYIVSKATLLNKPLVINASVGDYMGSHDGTNLESKMIDAMIKGPGKCLVASAGNAGAIPFHVGYNLNGLDTNFTWIYSPSPIIYVSEYTDSTQIKNIKSTIGVNRKDAGFTDLGNIGYKAYNYAIGAIKRDTIKKGTSRIGIIESVASINSDGVYELNYCIRADSLNYLWRIEHTGYGRIDSWNFEFATGGLPTATQYPKITKYKIADTKQTMVSGFQCSNEVITVGTYTNRKTYLDVNNTLQTITDNRGEIAASSSSGPTRDGRIKPDITASGSTILAPCVLSLLPNLITNAPTLVAKGGLHITSGGTSSASPIVAGFAALYLQKNPTATNQQIKDVIIKNATTDALVSLPVPNARWGYGKLCGFEAMKYLPIINTNIKINKAAGNIRIFPNPVEKFAHLLFENDDHKIIKLYNAVGQLLFSKEINQSEYLLNCTDFSEGLYLLICEEKQEIKKVKLLITNNK